MFHRVPVVLTGLCLATVGPIAGCNAPPRATTPPTVTAPPASADVLAAMRADLARQSPTARVGLVTDVLVDGGDRVLSVGDVQPGDFPDRAIVSILDSAGQLLAHGTVVRPLSNGVMVRFESVGGARRPAQGDVAVKF